MKSIRLNLFGKFIIAFISVGLLPIMLIGFYTSSRLRDNTYLMFNNTYRQAAVYGARSIDATIDRYNDLTKILYAYSPDSSDITFSNDGQGLARILKTGDGAIEQYMKKTSIESFLKNIYYSDRYILSMFFVERDGTVYSFSQQRRGLIDSGAFLETAMFEAAPDRTNKLIIIPTHENSYIQRRSNQVFMIGRNYLDLSYTSDYSTKILGTLYMDIATDAIDDIFNSLEIFESGDIFVSDSNGEFIYSNTGEAYRPVENNRDIVETALRTEDFGWEIRIRADYGKSMANIIDLIRIIYIIVILCLVILFCLSAFYSRFFTKPVKKILHNMKKIEAGDFDISISAGSFGSNDEMKMLADGLEHMALELKTYIESSFIAQIRRREAELNALKTQIQPHYLYNSLEIIRMSAVTNNDRDTEQLVFHLAKQMRYIIGEVSETVTLEKELDLIKSYFRFIDICYNHRITYEVTVPPELLDSVILKLIIQPVVENAVIHGLKPLGRGNVSIVIEKPDDNLRIIVLDNGIGMEDEILTCITESLNKNATGSKSEYCSIGLKNVHDRLKYKYGEEFGISVKSRKNVGTSVEIVQPLIKGSESDYVQHDNS